MQVDLQKLTKRYYAIGEVAELFDVSKSLIRYWESEFDLLKPHKNSKGDRRFTVQNIEQFQIIYNLVKEQGFTLEGAKKALKEQGTKINRQQQIIQKLQEIRKGLQDLSDQL
ncbi:MAG: MerR family transcriptional regulator [Saprospiraceae bacterium]|nr:MerR family transcriptional regulator [Saprospiraceae bacterium]MCB9314095.1 MerR family transcriptional regulator [Lewinellaceae bacterium]HRW75714.1 MerR family transcriptional regulator [Saprospiraceae bacterium]